MAVALGAVGVAAPLVAFAVGAAWRETGTVLYAAVYLLVAIPLLAIVGTLLAVRRPGNRISWILVALPITFGLGILCEEVAVFGLLRDDPLSWAAAAPWLGRLFMSLAAIPLVAFFVGFPDGRARTRGWSAFLRVWIVVHVTGTALSLLAPGRQTVFGHELPVVGPFEHEGFVVAAEVGRTLTADPVLPLALAVAVVAMIDRFRAADSSVRRQIAWVAYAAVPFGLVFAAGEALDGGPGDVLFLTASILATLVPVSIGLAILRYRLYEIDRIISRTVSYGLVVAVLGAVYVVAVVGLGGVVSGLTGEDAGDLVVAASVLAVVALFRPVRAPVQRAVDRRFNRSGYEARLAVEAFAHATRDEVELERIRRGIAETAAVAVQPATVSVWLRSTGGVR